MLRRNKTKKKNKGGVAAAGVAAAGVANKDKPLQDCNENANTSNPGGKIAMTSNSHHASDKRKYRIKHGSASQIQSKASDKNNNSSKGISNSAGTVQSTNNKKRYKNETDYGASPQDGSSDTISTASSPTLSSSSNESLESAYSTPVPHPAAPQSANNTSQSTNNNNINNSPNANAPQDDIELLENEIIKLSLSMTNIKKYTPQWFLLETKLKNATEELEAAKEDRDLHFGGTGLDEVEEIIMTQPINVQKEPKEVTTPIIQVEDENPAAAKEKSANEEVLGDDIPETVLLHNDIPLKDSSNIVQPNNMENVKVKEEGNTCNNNIKNDQSRTNDDNDIQSSTSSHIRIEYERIETELSTLPKFTPEWFQLKEELVELKIALDENEKEAELGGFGRETPTEINIVQTSSSSASSIGHHSESEKRMDKQQKQEEPPISPITPTSPSSYNDNQQHCHNNMSAPSSPPLSPTTMRFRHQLSSPGVDAGSPHCLSPYHSVTSNSQGRHSRSGSVASYNNNNPSNIYCFSFKDDDDGDREDITRLKTERSNALERLEHLQQFSKEWFALKTKIVGLSDQIDRFDDVDYSSSSEGSNTLRNQSMMSGWSSVMSESEEEIMSYADELEISMVSEALRQGQFSFDELLLAQEDEAEASRLDEELLLLPREGREVIRNIEVDRNQVAVVIQSWIRKTFATMRYRQLIREVSIVKIQALIRGKEIRQLYIDLRDKFILYQSIVRGRQQRKQYMHARDSSIAIQAIVRGRQQRLKYSRICECIPTIQTFLRGKCAAIKYYRMLSSAICIQYAWRLSVRKTNATRAKEAAAALEIARSNPKRREYDSLFDQMEHLLEEGLVDDTPQKEYYHACIIQKQWRLHWRCKPVISLRKRALNYYQEQTPRRFNIFTVIVLQNHWRKYTHQKEYTSLQSSAILIQSMVRMKSRHHLYKKQQSMSVVIQSTMRKYWISADKVYKDRREVTFHSSSLGIRLQRGKDGYVRVVAVTECTTEDESPSCSSPIVRDGTITPGDILFDAAGVDMRSPISKEQWGNAIVWMRGVLRPMTFVVANIPPSIQPLLDECEYVMQRLSELVHAEEVRASISIQSHVRQWLARCAYDRKLEGTILLVDCERMLLQLQMLKAVTIIQAYARRWLVQQKTSIPKATPSPIDKLEEKIMTLSMELMQMQDGHDWADAAERLKYMQEELRARQEMESQEVVVDHCTEKDNTSIEQESNSFSTLRDKFEVVLDAPIFPQDKVMSKKKATPPTLPSPEANSGETWSPENELRGINTVSKCRENLESDNHLITPAKAEDNLSGDTFTRSEKMKSLASELVQMSTRMASLPKMSPESTLLKIELKLVAEELQFLYAESQ